MTEHPFAGQSPFQQQQNQRNWQQPESSMAKADIEKLEEAQAAQQQRGLSKVGKLVLAFATAVITIICVLLLMIWLWGSGTMLSAFEDPALKPYLDSLR
ncbi:hypothetical protein [Corynebacterium freiburgense]|uniref:hypothetical protein n=1 Tax=Corynebacterium freiburgense TaxID=556548 RepID=UPI000413A4AC|nr:hypothetical protein [Corynebacterium freiburgense]WJZ03705.1 hypothetical protein CFREI_12240 [Corynebacterium freiburgense]